MYNAIDPGKMSRYYFEIPVKFVSSAAIDGYKGFLIVLIVIGHLQNALASSAPDFFRLIYNFHVACFFVLPFLYPIKRLSWEQVRTWYFRMFHPFFVFFFLYLLLFSVATKTIPTGIVLFEALTIETPRFLDRALGSQILWFLPAIFFMQIALSIVFTNLKPHVALLVLGSFLLQGFVGEVPRDIAFLVPFTLVIVAFLFFPGVVLRGIVLSTSQIRKIRVFYAALSVFLIAESISYAYRMYFGPAGLHLPSIKTPLHCLLTSTIIVSAALSILYNPYLEQIRLLRWYGRNSLAVYLIHQPVLLATWKISGNVLGQHLALRAIVAVLVSLIVCGGSIKILECLPRLRSIIFPRDYADFKKAWIGSATNLA